MTQQYAVKFWYTNEEGYDRQRTEYVDVKTHKKDAHDRAVKEFRKANPNIKNFRLINVGYC